jgi:hypothetical protein
MTIDKQFLEKILSTEEIVSEIDIVELSDSSTVWYVDVTISIYDFLIVSEKEKYRYENFWFYNQFLAENLKYNIALITDKTIFNSIDNNNWQNLLSTENKKTIFYKEFYPKNETEIRNLYVSSPNVDSTINNNNFERYENGKNKFFKFTKKIRFELDKQTTSKLEFISPLGVVLIPSLREGYSLKQNFINFYKLNKLQNKILLFNDKNDAAVTNFSITKNLLADRLATQLPTNQAVASLQSGFQLREPEALKTVYSDGYFSLFSSETRVDKNVVNKQPIDATRFFVIFNADKFIKENSPARQLALTIFGSDEQMLKKPLLAFSYSFNKDSFFQDILKIIYKNKKTGFNFLERQIKAYDYEEKPEIQNFVYDLNKYLQVGPRNNKNIVLFQDTVEVNDGTVLEVEDPYIQLSQETEISVTGRVEDNYYIYINQYLADLFAITDRLKRFLIVLRSLESSPREQYLSVFEQTTTFFKYNSNSYSQVSNLINSSNQFENKLFVSVYELTQYPNLINSFFSNLPENKKSLILDTLNKKLNSTTLQELINLLEQEYNYIVKNFAKLSRFLQFSHVFRETYNRKFKSENYSTKAANSIENEKEHFFFMPVYADETRTFLPQSIKNDLLFASKNSINFPIAVYRKGWLQDGKATTETRKISELDTSIFSATNILQKNLSLQNESMTREKMFLDLLIEYSKNYVNFNNILSKVSKKEKLLFEADNIKDIFYKILGNNGVDEYRRLNETSEITDSARNLISENLNNNYSISSQLGSQPSRKKTQIIDLISQANFNSAMNLEMLCKYFFFSNFFRIEILTGFEEVADPNTKTPFLSVNSPKWKIFTEEDYKNLIEKRLYPDRTAQTAKNIYMFRTVRVNIPEIGLANTEIINIPFKNEYFLYQAPPR